MQSHPMLTDEYDIVYEHQWIDSQTFNALASNGHFTCFDPGCVVIIDIKTFKPNETVLSAIFSQLETLQCISVFVSSYTLSEFSDTSFASYLDLFYPSDFSRLDTFFSDVLEQIFPEEEILQNTAILIDGDCLNFNFGPNANLNGLLSQPPFMTRFLNLLLERLQNLYPNVFSQYDTTDALNYLHSQNVNIFIHIGNDKYVSLCGLLTATGDDNVYEQIDSVSMLPTTGDSSYDYVYAIGFLALNGNFYDFLYQDQSSITAIFIMDTEIPEYGEGGLPASFASEMSEPSNEETELFALLLELLGIDPID